MRTWRRFDGEKLCGRCAQPIYRGQPFLEIQLPSVHERLTRCIDCAEESVPADLPPLTTPEPPKPMMHVPSGPNTLPLDFKPRQTGESA